MGKLSWVACCTQHGSNSSAEHSSGHQEGIKPKESQVLTSNKDVNLGHEVLVGWGVVMDAGEVTGVIGRHFPDDERAAALPRAISAAAEVHPGVFPLVLPQKPAHRRCSPVNTPKLTTGSRLQTKLGLRSRQVLSIFLMSLSLSFGHG